MTSVNEILQLCRLCLVKEDVNVPIFEEQGDLRQIFLKISACLPVKVSKEDDLPKSICDGCSCKLEMLYQFWNTSASSEKKLIKLISQAAFEKENPPADKNVQHSMNLDPMILKQEVVEVADNQNSPDNLVPDDLNVSNDAQDYILQQQQLPYQNVEFQFQQDGFEETTGDDVATAVEPEVPRTRKRRAAAMRALANMGSEEDEDDADLIDTKIAKTEEQSDSGGEDPEPTAFVGLPSATDNEQPGPSGVGKTSGDAPFNASMGSNIRKNNLSTKPVSTKHKLENIKRKYGIKECVVLLGDLKNFNIRRFRPSKKMMQLLMYIKCRSISIKLERIKIKKKPKPLSLQPTPRKSIALERIEIGMERPKSPRHPTPLPLVRPLKNIKKPRPLPSPPPPAEPPRPKEPAEAPSAIHIFGRSYEKQSYKCSDCDEVFEDELKYKRHTTIHMVKRSELGNKQLHNCFICKRNFATRSLLWMHMRTHSQKAQYVCKDCHANFGATHALHAHKKLCPKRKDVIVIPDTSLRETQANFKYRCSVCLQKFQDVHEMRLHKESHWEKETTVPENVTNSVLRNVLEDDVACQEPEVRLQKEYYREKESMIAENITNSSQCNILEDVVACQEQEVRLHVESHREKEATVAENVTNLLHSNTPEDRVAWQELDMSLHKESSREKETTVSENITNSLQCDTLEDDVACQEPEVRMHIESHREKESTASEKVANPLQCSIVEDNVPCQELEVSVHVDSHWENETTVAENVTNPLQCNILEDNVVCQELEVSLHIDPHWKNETTVAENVINPLHCNVVEDDVGYPEHESHSEKGTDNLLQCNITDDSLEDKVAYQELEMDLHTEPLENLTNPLQCHICADILEDDVAYQEHYAFHKELMDLPITKVENKVHEFLLDVPLPSVISNEDTSVFVLNDYCKDEICLAPEVTDNGVGSSESSRSDLIAEENVLTELPATENESFTPRIFVKKIQDLMPAPSDESDEHKPVSKKLMREQLIFKCNECNMAFKKRRSFRKHERIAKFKHKCYSCSFCTCSFVNFKKHCLAEHNISYVCHICKKPNPFKDHVCIKAVSKNIISTPVLPT